MNSTRSHGSSVSSSSNKEEDSDKDIGDYFAGFSAAAAEDGGTTDAAPLSSSAAGVCAPDWDAYPHCPIYIPSRGRYDQTRGTMAMLVRDLVPCTLVVEPEEVEVYRQLVDRLVFELFGAAGMSLAGPADAIKETTGEEPKIKEEEEEEADGAPAAAKAKWSGCRNCYCCVMGPSTVQAEVAPPAAALLYHHGYTFGRQPPSTVKMESGDEGERTAASTSPLTNGWTSWTGKHGARVPAPAFCLRSVDAVRALFTVAALPRGGLGVSYVRNYILHVLVPAAMVAAGVDRTGHVEEMEALLGKGAGSAPSAAYLSNVKLRSMQVPLPPAAEPPATPHEVRTQKSAEEGHARHGGASVPTRDDPSAPAFAPSAFVPPHALYGYYWVLDDDIACFSVAASTAEDGTAAAEATRRNVRVSARETMRLVSQRVTVLRATAAASADNDSARVPEKDENAAPLSSAVAALPAVAPRATSMFTSKEDCVLHNLLPVRRQTGTGTRLNLRNFTDIAQTACISLEYGHYAYTYGDDALAVNSYNNIACLFNYHLLHCPQRTVFFPPNVPLAGVRTSEQTVGCGLAFSHVSLTTLGQSPADGGDSSTTTGAMTSREATAQVNDGGNAGMLWYKFTVREDYDFTLQLIARGYCTVRLRNLSFEVPQMARVRGGMTDFYKSATNDIARQNRLFVEQWPAVAVQCAKGKSTSNERADIRVRWDLLHPLRARQPGAFLYLNAPLPQLSSAAGPQQQQQQQRRVEEENGRDAATASTQRLLAATAPGAPRPPPPPPPPPPKRRRRRGQNGGSSSSSSSSSSDSSVDGDAAVDMTRAGAPPAPPAPPPSFTFPDIVPLPRDGDSGSGSGAAAATASPPSPHSTSGWRGYAVERWRNLQPAEAAQLGLRTMPVSAQCVGKTVAVVPTSFSHSPSCVLGTLIERQGGAGGVEPTWTVVAQRARGIPLLSVAATQVYEPPSEEDGGVARMAAAIDFFFSNVQSPQTGAGAGGSGGGGPPLTRTRVDSSVAVNKGDSSWLDD